MFEIAIVGGGPGGLMSAWHLATKLGPLVKVTIYEASQRLGGKIRTDSFASGSALYEAGVAEIYDYSGLGHDPLRNLIEQTCGLQTVPMDSDSVVLDGRLLHGVADMGRVYGKQTFAEINRVRALCAKSLSPDQYYEGASRDDNEHPWADMTQREWLDEQVTDPVARRFFQIMARSDIAAEPHLTSGLNALKNMLMDVPGYLEVYSIQGGNEQLVKRLSELHQADVELGHRVTRIGRTQSGRYRLALAADKREVVREVDLVLVCLPHSWLGTVSFDGPELASAVADHVAYFDRPAHYLRLAVLLETAFWQDELKGSWFMSESFGGCCVYDEGARHPTGGKGVLNWLIPGSDALAWVGSSPADVLDMAILGLPETMRAQARAQVLEARVHPYISSVNAIPGGAPVRTARRNHVPEPTMHEGIILTGDYLFDSTLNGLLDSADFATDLAVTAVMKQRYQSGVARRAAATAPRPVLLPEHSLRVDRTYFDNYRGAGAYAENWRRFSDPDRIAIFAQRIWGLRPGGSILVAGSASGELVAELRAMNFDAHGVENNRWIHARTPVGLAAYNVLGSVTALPFEDRQFDLVIDSCLCHVAPRQVGKAVREIARVSRGGLLFRSVTSDLDPDLLDRHDLLRGVRSLGTVWEWSERFFDAGFDIAIQNDALLEELWLTESVVENGLSGFHEDAESLRGICFTIADQVVTTNRGFWQSQAAE